MQSCNNIIIVFTTAIKRSDSKNSSYVTLVRRRTVIGNCKRQRCSDIYRPSIKLTAYQHLWVT
ncbi:hypothetical protein T4D_7886 [Trichinella pseudospiralis]|uniref:Uncharacterized protein n=1 Tax=Trichinella pseudospiralis TaxID=6337 RepID=A0A0V1FCD3_TRIPS|nr:hypothetical protein T4D_7886 [Trichinella pseudospiralis]